MAGNKEGGEVVTGAVVAGLKAGSGVECWVVALSSGAAAALLSACSFGAAPKASGAPSTSCESFEVNNMFGGSAAPALLSSEGLLHITNKGSQ